jgi:hypothetical protein
MTTFSNFLKTDKIKQQARYYLSLSSLESFSRRRTTWPLFSAKRLAKYFVFLARHAVSVARVLEMFSNLPFSHTWQSLLH